MVARRVRSPDAGFTYVGLVIFVAILGLVGAATLKVDSLLRRVAAEQELLEIGAEYSEALRSYAAATPRGYPTAPPTMQELLKDPRFPGTRRHLRKIYVDPLTGKQEWGIVYQGDNVGVLAVYSLSQAQPLKLANFDARFQNFENKQHLSEWKFTASGTGASASGSAVANGQPPALQPNKPNTPNPQPASLFPAPEAAPPTVPPAPEPAESQAKPQDETADKAEDAPPENDAEPPREPEEPPARSEPAEAEPAPPAEPPAEEGRPGGR